MYQPTCMLLDTYTILMPEVLLSTTQLQHKTKCIKLREAKLRGVYRNNSTLR